MARSRIEAITNRRQDIRKYSISIPRSLDESYPESSIDKGKQVNGAAAMKKRKISRQVIPHPKPNEVLIKLLAGGVCHSDVGILDPHSNLNKISNNHYTLGMCFSG